MRGSSGSVQQRCQCNNNLTFQDRYGNTHGACRRADETGRTWCYTYGGCPDSQPSKRFPQNPWSYQARSVYGNSNGFVRSTRNQNVLDTLDINIISISAYNIIVLLSYYFFVCL